jgi:hypothetical protein
MGKNEYCPKAGKKYIEAGFTWLFLADLPCRKGIPIYVVYRVGWWWSIMLKRYMLRPVAHCSQGSPLLP